MASNLLACPHCHQPVAVPAELSGRTMSCPHCRRAFQTAPGPSQPARPGPPLPATPASSPPQRAFREPAAPVTAKFTTTYLANFLLGGVGVILVLAGFFVPVLISTVVERDAPRAVHYSLLDLLEHDIGGGTLSAFSIAAVLVLVSGIAAGGLMPLKRFVWLAVCAAAVIVAVILTMIEVQATVQELRAQSRNKPRNELFVGQEDAAGNVELDMGLAIALSGACVLFVSAFYPPKRKRILG